MRLSPAPAQHSRLTRFIVEACAFTVIAICAFALGPQARASMITYQLNTYHGTTPSTIGSYGTVTLTQDGSNVDVMLTLASSPNQVGFVNTGAGDALLWDMSVSPISITGLSSGFELVSTSSANDTIHADGSGYWDYAITCAYTGGNCQASGGSNPYTGSLSFTVQNVTLGDFMPNPAGNNFASDVCVDVVSGSCAAGANTGVISGGPSTSVPEPQTLALFAVGLAVLGFALRRRARATLRH